MTKTLVLLLLLLPVPVTSQPGALNATTCDRKAVMKGPLRFPPALTVTHMGPDRVGDEELCWGRALVLPVLLPPKEKGQSVLPGRM